MKKAFKRFVDILTVLAVTVFITSWLNVLPTIWKPEILDQPLMFGITVRSCLTFLIFLTPVLLLYKHVAKFKKIIWLAALLPFILWLLHVLFYIRGGSKLAQMYPIFGIMLVYTVALMVEALILEIKNHTLSWKDLFEDFLFSLALSVLFYGILTLWGITPFCASALGMSPVLAIVQLVLAKAYHTPKIVSDYDSEAENFDEDHPVEEVPLDAEFTE